MAKKYNLQNSEVNLENININSQGPSADDLKIRFKEGSIPLQTDYADLINIADIGRKACGQAPQQNGPGQGLKLADDGTLNLKIGTLSSQDFSPLMLKDDILSIDLGSGLVNKTNGICVGQGNGIVVNTNDVAVKAANGITVNGSGVAVKANNGINVDTNGVSVKSKNSTIKVESTGISVGIGWGVKIGGDGLDVKANNGINVDSNGVSVKAGNGITVNSSGVSIDPNKVLPRGMIVMFSGSSVPTGWALCDGNNGTPNLIDRFILGGNFSGIDGKSNNTVSGDKNNKSFSFKSDATTLNISGKTNGSSLSIAQIPNHQHLGGIIMDTDKSNNYGSSKISTNKWGVPTAQNTSVRYVYHSSGIVGSSGTINSNSPDKHAHDIDLKNTGSHSHNNKVTVPYYILAFIMKL
ncbi:tail fiber protein [Photorhabdus asymbiotica]|uniref:tail fiber protein n=1 Tax=Photorhabdus asymbiotica TaxID=291112 RepID=UPI003DA6E3FF